MVSNRPPLSTEEKNRFWGRHGGLLKDHTAQYAQAVRQIEQQRQKIIDRHVEAGGAVTEIMDEIILWTPGDGDGRP